MKIRRIQSNLQELAIRRLTLKTWANQLNSVMMDPLRRNKSTLFLDNSWVGTATKICINDRVQKKRKKLYKNTFSKSMATHYSTEPGMSKSGVYPTEVIWGKKKDDIIIRNIPPQPGKTEKDSDISCDYVSLPKSFMLKYHEVNRKRNKSTPGAIIRPESAGESKQPQSL
mmetsp:Transcript_6622/g.6204  ORF Transcript_6622/g.6204 Transcript_6622/m.6204 type:complete len:170 (-) Transcript_6622:11-520(-)